MGVVAGFLAGMGTIEWPYLKICEIVPENGYLQL
jgi:hypothetical protein